MSLIIAATIGVIVGLVGVIALLLDRRRPVETTDAQRATRQQLLNAGFLWIIFTAISLLGAKLMDPFPTVGANEAAFSDHAFRAMTYLAAPVFGFMMAALLYSVIYFRAARNVGDAETPDGAPYHGTGRIPIIWLVVTTALTVVVMIYPGLTGLAEIRADRSHDIEIAVTGVRWAWIVDYPEGFQANELVLPVNKRVKFDITAPAGDVLHSFWVPAFRQKVDAVPGLVTHLYITPTVVGDGANDVAYRVQCAELCGLMHGRMQMNVRVVDQAEYDLWVAGKVKK